MKTHIHISALLVVASALLSSCTLLEPSPLPHYNAHVPGFYGGIPHSSYRVYNGFIQVPAEGGIYQFDCADDQFYISRIFDSSMPVPQRHSNCRYSPDSDDYESVNDLEYSGSFYTITCNKNKHNWVIKVDPLSSGEDYRKICVYMWDGSDDSDFIFRFEQGGYDSLEGIQ